MDRDILKNIKMIALDLDNTTLLTNKTISDRTKTALEEAIKRGIFVVAASGRAFYSLPQCILDLEGIQYAITGNGVAVYSIPEEKRIKSFPMNPDHLERLLDLVPETIMLEAFVEGRAYSLDRYIEEAISFGLSPLGAEYIRATRNPVDDIRAFIRNHRREIDSIDLVIPDPTERDHWHEKLEKELPQLYYTTSAPQLVEISSTSGGKKDGVEWLANHLGIAPSEIAAFGDADNDIDMLEYAGLGVAVANARPRVLAAADYITASNTQDGVAKVVELMKI